MADTYTPSLKVRLPETGQYNNTWGVTLNSDALTLLDHAITGQKTINVGTGTSFSLPALTNGSAADSRYFSLYMTGTPSGTCTVTLPASVTKKVYLIDNQTGQTLTFGYATGPTVNVLNGERKIIWADSVGVYSVGATIVDATTVGGLSPSVFWRLDAGITNVTLATYRSPWVTVTEAPTTTIDASAGMNQILTLTGNRTMATPTNPADGREIDLIVLQDGTGGRTLTWAGAFIFENSVAPTLASAPNQYDYFRMKYLAATSKWLVSHAYNLGTTGAAAAYTYTINENTVDWNLLAKTGTPGSAITVNLLINTGVVVQASCTGTPAMDLTGLPSGSTINMTNLGYIIGKGGNGGDGGSGAGTAAQGIREFCAGMNGRPAGNAIRGPGAGVTLNIVNASGFIWGGGGGGGGGTYTLGSGVDQTAAGGGGGGGAGGGEAGQGANVLAAAGAGASHGGDGFAGSTGPNGAGGTGGTGQKAGGASAVYNGGAGGGFGAAGSAGSNGTSTDGAGGAAGKAIDLQGGTANFSSGSASPHVKGAVS